MPTNGRHRGVTANPLLRGTPDGVRAVLRDASAGGIHPSLRERFETSCVACRAAKTRDYPLGPLPGTVSQVSDTTSLVERDGRNAVQLSWA